MDNERNQQYGIVAVKNDFLNQEQFDECYNFMVRIQKKNPQKEINVEHILFEKGYISDSQHGVVLSVMKRLGQRRKTSVTDKPVQCRHCGTPNAADALECESCQGKLAEIKLEVDEENVRTCPHCAADIGAETLSCKCGVTFCPQCRALRHLGDTACGTCSFMFPESGKMPAVTGVLPRTPPAAAPAGGFSQAQLAGMIGGAMILLLVLLFAITRGGEDIEQLEMLSAEMNGHRREAQKLMGRRKYRDASTEYTLAMEVADKIRRQTKDSDRLEDLDATVTDIEKRQTKLEALIASLKPKPDNPGPDNGGPDRTPPKKGPDKTPPKKGPDKTPPKKGPDKIPPKKGPGKTGPRTFTSLPVLPENMTPDELAFALKNLRALGLSLPEAPRVAQDKLLLLFLSNGEEVIGVATRESEQMLQMTTLTGRRRSIIKSKIIYRVKGKYYDRGPEVALVGRNGRAIPGKPIKIDEEYVEVSDGGESTPILRRKVRASAFYRVYRYLNTPKTAEGHIKLARLCATLRLPRQSSREYREAGRQSPEAMLRVLPYLKPKLFLDWRVKRQCKAEELIAVAQWARKAIGPREMIEVYLAAVEAHKILDYNGPVQLGIAQGYLDLKQYKKAEQVLLRVRGSLPGPLRGTADDMLKSMYQRRSAAVKKKSRTDVEVVMKAFFSILREEAKKIARNYDDFSRVSKHCKGNHLWRLVMGRVVKKTKLPLDEVSSAFRRRFEHPEAYKGMRVEYTRSTWMVDTPDTLTYHFGTDKMETERDIFWRKLRDKRARAALVIGIFAEEKLKVEVLKKKCPRCKGTRALSGLEQVQVQLKRMDRHCKGTGYYRTIDIR